MSAIDSANLPAASEPAGGLSTARHVPLLSIVMPVRNEVNAIARTLGQLLAQDFDPRSFEIIVVDGQSTDDTCNQVATVISRHPNVRLLSNPKRLSSAARNIGVRAAKGKYILIVDGHCEIKTTALLSNVVRAFRESGADCLGRPQPLDISGANRLQQAIAVARSSRLGHHPDSFIYSDQPRFVPAHSVAVAYRRDVFEKVGYFDETFDACEDVEFNTRIDKAGLRCYFAPDIAVHYVPRATLTALFKQLARYGRGRTRLMRKHRETFSAKTLLPAVFVGGVFAGTPLSIANRWMAIAFLAGLLVYSSAIVLESVRLSSKRRMLGSWWRVAAVFVYVHAGSGWGVLSEAFNPRRISGHKQATGLEPDADPEQNHKQQTSLG